MRVRPWEVEPGDRITGTSHVVTGWHYRQHDVGGDVENQRYVIETASEVPYAGDSWVDVVRNTDPAGLDEDQADG